MKKLLVLLAPGFFYCTTYSQHTFQNNGLKVGVGTPIPAAKFTINGTSVAGAGSQTNISAFLDNGIRIDGSGGTYTQDAITYQSAMSGAGAAIAFGRYGSYDTYMSFYTNPCCAGPTGGIVERMRLNDNGNLGIGTISPQSKLHVIGSSILTSSTALGTNSVGYPDNFGMYYADRGNLWTEVTVHNKSSGAMLYANPQASSYSGMWGTTYPSSSAGLLSNPYVPLVLGAGKETMRISPEGRIGIGTAFPKSKLEVVGTTNDLLTLTSTVGNTNNTANLYMDTYPASDHHVSRIQVIDNGDWSGNVTFSTKMPGGPANALAERLRIASNGKVGIGTKDPSQKLHVVGQALITKDSSFECCSYGKFTLAIAENTASTGNKASISFHNNGQDNGNIELSRDAGFRSIKFYDHQNQGLGIDVTGNARFSKKVAIGGVDFTRLNDYALAVNGSAIFSKVQVKATSSPWPDYVFNPDYKLRSLSDVESYIKKHNHLPEVPSAAEVEKDGQDLGAT
ncbi:MAG: hypothetical protein JWQ40_4246, partial [Segetibacter sp.]|nr:hypothetical protein [Segetibacter sp.]